MVSKVGPEDLDLVIKFGGGLHTRASEDEIDPREAADGANFTLDLENRQLRPRDPFDLVGTAPNAESIRGGASFVDSAGTTYFLIQAGDTVYDWDGDATFTAVGSVNANAKLRGHWRTHGWPINDRILITDLGLLEEVKQWDGGSSFSDVAFLSDPSTSFGAFFSKYVAVVNERAVFAHVKDGSGTYPHLLVGSSRGDYTTLTVANRPSSSLSAEDPFFIPVPDLKPINAIAPAFGTLLFSTEKGVLIDLTGSDARDFALDEFYPGSAASGDESLVYAGNDMIYGRQGRIEAVIDTNRFGDSEANDITRAIANRISSYTKWTMVYNARVDRVYCFPTSISECWVLQNAMRNRQDFGGSGELSPWMKWTTLHSLAFQPTFAMSMLDPADGLEYVFMGDGSGNLYRLEGSGSGDGGTADIAVEWLTKLFSADLDAEIFDVTGYIKYRKEVPATVTLIFEYSGRVFFNETITIEIPSITDKPYYSNQLYYSDGNYYASVSGKLTRQAFQPQGQSNEFQVRVKVQGQTNFTLNEIGLRFRAAG